MRIKVVYSGDINSGIDRDIIAIMSKRGYCFSGSGYNLKTGDRDIGFDDGEGGESMRTIQADVGVEKVVVPE